MMVGIMTVMAGIMIVMAGIILLCLSGYCLYHGTFSANFDCGQLKYFLCNCCVWTFPSDTAVCAETIPQWARLHSGIG